MNCCNNPQDLGCILSCEGVYTNVSADCAGTYTITYNYNGAIVTRDIMSNGSGGYLVVPGNTFPEGTATTFSIMSSSGVELGCYKVRVFPQQPNIYADSEPWGTISSDIVLTQYASCAPVQSGGFSLGVTGVLTLNDINLLKNGTEITIGAMWDQGSPVQGAIYQSFTAGTSMSGNVITITDKSLIVSNTITYRIHVFLSACGQTINFKNYVACYSNLPVGVAVGTQSISNAI